MCTLNYLVRDCIVSDLRHRCWASFAKITFKAPWFILLSLPCNCLKLAIDICCILEAVL